MTAIQYIDKRLVHRHHEHESFLESSRQDDEGLSYSLSIDKNHHLLTGAESHPPLIVMLEIVRQLSIATCHVHDGIPVAGHAVAGQIHFEWSSAPLSLEQLNSSRSRVLVRSRVVGRNSFCANAISFTMEFMHGRRSVGLGSMSASWTTDREYRILRGHKVFAATTNTNYDPIFLGNVLKRRNTLCSELTWDCRDTFYFDHAADHVPGMVMAGASIEAFQHLHPDVSPDLIDVRFYRYAELDAPVTLTTLDTPEDTTTNITFTQDNQHLCKSTVKAKARWESAC